MHNQQWPDASAQCLCDVTLSSNLPICEQIYTLSPHMCYWGEKGLSRVDGGRRRQQQLPSCSTGQKSPSALALIRLGWKPFSLGTVTLLVASSPTPLRQGKGWKCDACWPMLHNTKADMHFLYATQNDDHKGSRHSSVSLLFYESKIMEFMIYHLFLTSQWLAHNKKGAGRWQIRVKHNFFQTKF